jgi:beta-glucanase (GH16 family)
MKKHILFFLLLFAHCSFAQTNLLTNPGFEQDYTDWGKNFSPGAATFSITNTGVHGGTKAACVKVEKSGNYWDIQLLRTPTTFKQDSTFTFKFWAKADSPNAEITWTLSEAATFSEMASGGMQPIKLTTQWKEYAYTFTMPKTTQAYFSVSVAFKNSLNSTICFDDFSLTYASMLPAAMKDNDPTPSVAAAAKTWQRAKAMGYGLTLEVYNGNELRNTALPAYTKSYIANLAKMNVKTIRCVSGVEYMVDSVAPYNVNQNHPGWKILDSLIAWSSAYNIKFIIDNHMGLENKNGGANIHWKEKYAAQTATRVAAMWQKIAIRYKNVSPELLFFEIKNEPGMTARNNEEMFSNNSMRVMNNAVINAVRLYDKERTLIATSTAFSHIDTLIITRPYNDNNIIYTFHEYHPGDFTHQGFNWYPNPAPIDRQFPIGTDMAILRQHYKKAKMWSNKYNVPVTNGEFGVSGKADPISRCNFIKASCALMDSLAIPANYFAQDGYYYTFGFFKTTDQNPDGALPCFMDALHFTKSNPTIPTSKIVYKDSKNEVIDAWTNGTNTTVTETTANAPYEGSKHYQIDYKATTGWNGAGLNFVNTTNEYAKTPLDFTDGNYTHLRIAYKGLNAGQTLQAQLSYNYPYRIAYTGTQQFKYLSKEGAIVKIGGNSTGYQVIDIPLSSFVNPSNSQTPLRGLWFVSRISFYLADPTQSGTFYIDGIELVNKNTTTPTPAPSNCWNMVWSDEFEGTTLDKNKWTPQIGDKSFWGNGEYQYHREENISVSNGKLILAAKKENFTTTDGKQYQYTGGRVYSKSTADFKFGKIEARIKLPTAQGSFSSFWLFPTEEKTGVGPKSGEIDVVEVVGNTPNTAYTNIHTQSKSDASKMVTTSATYNIAGGVSSDFHTYTMEWAKDTLRFYIDGNLYKTTTANTFTDANWLFNEKFHLIFGNSIGSDWSGAPGANNVYPVNFEVDYIRVYQKLEDVAISGQQLVLPNATKTYTVPTIAGTTYNWSVPAGATITAGQGTAAVNVNWAGVDGKIKVELKNSCTTKTVELAVESAKSPAQSLSIFKGGTSIIKSTWATEAKKLNITAIQPFDGAEQYKFDYSKTSWWDGFMLALDANGVNFKPYTHLRLAYRGLHNGDVISLEIASKGNVLSGYKRLGEASKEYTLIEIPLADLVGSSKVDLMQIVALNFGVLSANTSSGTLYVDAVELINKTATPAPVVCAVPTPTATNVGNTSASIAWAAISGAQGYELRYKIKGTTTWINKAITTVSTDLTALTTNSTYEYEVRTKCSATDFSNFSTTKEFVTKSCAVVTPYMSLVGGTRAVVRWKASTDVSGYELSYRPKGRSNWSTKTISDAANIGQDLLMALTANTTYEVRLRTLCPTTNGYTDYSAIIEFKTLPAPPPNARMASSIDDKGVEGNVEVSFYPNPTIGTVTLQMYNEESGTGHIVVSNLSGNTILTVNDLSLERGIQTQAIDLSRFDNGVYIISLTRGQSRISKKVVLNK